ncbi:hypothetical protein [Allokutzneria sp. NRRL B-24872]|uniref:hypothetical protein n=1 Tax=Allokutzneria sp. NRRL B-24872 TaxID=1137961 RepID=UPI0011781F13|nr:hypothetical protein [Allokutzneria sp. NRRL B-24872]
MNDVLAQINLQLPLIAEGATKLPTSVVRDGVFGGAVTRSAEIYLLSSAGHAFSPLRAATVRVSGSGGTVQTPARLLSGIGVSLFALDVDAVDAFRRDALPRLSLIAETRTKITVGSYYDLTVTVLSPSSLAFVFTPVGVVPPPGAESLGV